MIPLAAIAAASLAAWLILVLRHGGFWRADVLVPDAAGPTPSPPPRVAVIIPARDEAPTIGEAVASLLAQDYQGLAAVFVVDDNSTDGTAEAAAAGSAGDRRLHVVAGAPLAEGWSGKVWAMNQGVAAVRESVPDAEYLLFTDADIAHAPAELSSLVRLAEAGDRDLVSLMVRLDTRGSWARLLIPAFVFFFQKLYPFSWVASERRPTAAAAGGCMLVRRAALDVAGGLAAIQDRLIDDCALASLLKKRGAIWLGLARDTRSLRPYDGLDDIWRMVARTAFEQLNHSYAMVAFATLGMALVYLAPPLCTIASLGTGDGTAFAMGLLAWGLMTVAYVPTLRFYDEPVWRAVLLPVAAVLYAMMTVDSARRAAQGHGGGWKGRSYRVPGRGGG